MWCMKQSRLILDVVKFLLKLVVSDRILLLFVLVELDSMWLYSIVLLVSMSMRLVMLQQSGQLIGCIVRVVVVELMLVSIWRFWFQFGSQKFFCLLWWVWSQVWQCQVLVFDSVFSLMVWVFFGQLCCGLMVIGLDLLLNWFIGWMIFFDRLDSMMDLFMSMLCFWY